MPLETLRLLRATATCGCLLLLGVGQSFAEEVETGRKPFGHNLANTFENTNLPFIGPDSEFRIDLNPKIGDLLDDPYFRFPIRGEYSFTPTFEGHLGYTPFLNNPFASDPKNSLGYLKYGAKKRIDALHRDRLAIALGFDVRLPLETIPTEWIRDNYDTYSPYVVAAYEIDQNGEWTIFTNVRYDILDRSSPELSEPIDPPNSLSSITFGGVHHPSGDFRYALRALYQTDRYDGGTSDGLKLIPSVTWYTRDNSPFFRNIAGNFEITVELEYALKKLPEQHLESDLGVSIDLKWRFHRKIIPAKNDLMP